MIRLITNELPSVNESLNTFNLDVIPSECAYCQSPHPSHKAVDFKNIDLKFCNQDCEDAYNYLEYILNK